MLFTEHALVEPSAEIALLCRDLAQVAPDVESGDETEDAVYDYWVEKFRLHGHEVLARVRDRARDIATEELLNTAAKFIASSARKPHDDICSSGVSLDFANRALGAIIPLRNDDQPLGLSGAVEDVQKEISPLIHLALSPEIWASHDATKREMYWTLHDRTIAIGRTPAVFHYRKHGGIDTYRVWSPLFSTYHAVLFTPEHLEAELRHERIRALLYSFEPDLNGRIERAKVTGSSDPKEEAVAIDGPWLKETVDDGAR